MKLVEKIVLIFFITGTSIVLGLGVYGNLTAPPWWDPALNCTPNSVVTPAWLPPLLFFGLASLVGSCVVGLIITNKS